MTDKQIIIDGVDVSKCIYFQQEDDEYTCGAEECNGAIVACRACDNCYYKQLKAKEQECDMWKNLTVDNGAVALKYQQQLDQLKKANEEKNELLAKLGCPTIATARMKAFTLQQQLEAYKMEAEEGKEINAELKAENEELKEALNEGCLHNLTLMTEQRVLLQTLTEIKEICNNNDELQGNFNLVDCDKYRLGKHNLAQKIIAKINEVEDEHKRKN